MICAVSTPEKYHLFTAHKANIGTSTLLLTLLIILFVFLSDVKVLHVGKKDIYTNSFMLLNGLFLVLT